MTSGLKQVLEATSGLTPASDTLRTFVRYAQRQNEERTMSTEQVTRAQRTVTYWLISQEF